MMKRLFPFTSPATGLSFLEVMAAVTLAGIVALIAIPRFAGHTTEARNKACNVNRGNIEVQAQLWYRDHGSWPATDLSDIGADPDYFPAGLPTCPVDGSSYRFDPATQKVTGHEH